MSGRPGSIDNRVLARMLVAALALGFVLNLVASWALAHWSENWTGAVVLYTDEQIRAEIESAVELSTWPVNVHKLRSAAVSSVEQDVVLTVLAEPSVNCRGWANSGVGWKRVTAFVACHAGETEMGQHVLPLDFDGELTKHGGGWPYVAVERVFLMKPDAAGNGTWKYDGARWRAAGLVANSVFLALAIFLCVDTPLLVRRERRMRRGRCPACGYDVRGRFVDGCSECGRGRTR